MMKFKFVWEDHTYISPKRAEKFKAKLVEHWHESDDYAKQELFIYGHVEEFFDLFEQRWIQKILGDISYILGQKWAFSICEEDFNHGHICGRTKTSMMSLDALLSVSNVCFLYHTFEERSWLPLAVNRNVLSFPDGHPEVVHLDHEFGKSPGYGVSSKKLGLTEYARFHFEESSKGSYTLKDEARTDLWEVFP
jgi:hypothetical protein